MLVAQGFSLLIYLYVYVCVKYVYMYMKFLLKGQIKSVKCFLIRVFKYENNQKARFSFAYCSSAIHNLTQT